LLESVIYGAAARPRLNLSNESIINCRKIGQILQSKYTSQNCWAENQKVILGLVITIFLLYLKPAGDYSDFLTTYMCVTSFG
jgi:hypothetical protein